MSEEAAIREMLAAWCAATDQPGEAGADGYAAFVTEDVINLPPNGERLDGRDALRAWTLGLTGADDWSVQWEPRDIVVAASGDLAYAIGVYELRMRDPEGSLIDDKGTFLDTLVKQADGSWKASAISYSSDLPA
jgi:ketosteroid isomerase-like protein